MQILVLDADEDFLACRLLLSTAVLNIFLRHHHIFAIFKLNIVCLVRGFICELCYDLRVLLLESALANQANAWRL